MLVEDIIKEVSIDYIQKTPVYKGIQDALVKLQKAEEVAYAYATSEDSDFLKTLKMGTALSIAISQKFCEGKQVKDYTKEDWIDIAEKVADIAILEDAKTYTERVFLLYAEYIDASVTVNKNVITEKYWHELQLLSGELRQHSEMLEADEISESDYVDQCLWISFEAIIKLYASFTVGKLKPEYQDLVVSTADFAVQYARLNLYTKEHDLIEAYIEHQGQLDIELSKKYEDYIAELQASSEQFEELMENAFAPDFRNQLMASAQLARNIGVPEDQILDSVKKIDSFFE